MTSKRLFSVFICVLGVALVILGFVEFGQTALAIVLWVLGLLATTLGIIQIRAAFRTPPGES
jgi:uncharacterized membrane protein HdeD (DUF308 family)